MNGDSNFLRNRRTLTDAVLRMNHIRLCSLTILTHAGECGQLNHRSSLLVALKGDKARSYSLSVALKGDKGRSIELHYLSAWFLVCAACSIELRYLSAWFLVCAAYPSQPVICEPTCCLPDKRNLLEIISDLPAISGASAVRVCICSTPSSSYLCCNCCESQCIRAVSNVLHFVKCIFAM